MVHHPEEKAAEEDARYIENKFDAAEYLQLGVSNFFFRVRVEQPEGVGYFVAGPHRVVTEKDDHMYQPQLHVELEHGLALHDGFEAHEDVANHDNQADLQSDGEVGHLLVCLGARSLERIEGFIDEMSQQNCHDNDHCGVEALARRCNLNIRILGILPNLDQNGKRDGQLEILVKDDPMRHKHHQERQLKAGHVKELLPEIPLPLQE